MVRNLLIFLNCLLLNEWISAKHPLQLRLLYVHYTFNKRMNKLYVSISASLWCTWKKRAVEKQQAVCEHWGLKNIYPFLRQHNKLYLLFCVHWQRRSMLCWSQNYTASQCQEEFSWIVHQENNLFSLLFCSTIFLSNMWICHLPVRFPLVVQVRWKLTDRFQTEKSKKTLWLNKCPLTGF